MSDVYKTAGVDVEAGYQAVELMKKHITRTNRAEVIGGVGAFAGLFDLTGFSYDEPVLVSGTDGVGTKLKIAFELDRHDTVGIDLVAMCVNDIVAQGADPLFFLDYIACGKTYPEKIEQIVKGIADGCVQSGTALIGGETAEMPGMYQDGEYDLAGFVVGIANKPDLISGTQIQAGDALIGLASSGVHSNGFSLVRKILSDRNLKLTDKPSELTTTIGEALLKPTKIYYQSISQLKKTVKVKGISHITGGGFYENLPRILPNGLGADIWLNSWEIPEILTFLQTQADLSIQAALGVFNMGIGMVVVVAQDEVDQALEALQACDSLAYLIGEVTDKSGVKLVER
ncbi:phosphoribosylformylglycinamidine cyclo-ligase [Amphibacillus xylanus]|uniref:Phosphoribosylformylglycinamidine cyclo-ligase n=1 Tax=Amphibacillus xylanus (strain ATCC 51415 / DSM 6626 / JCM 7361 / LMG 17667 / NBRC 15112 / Ep01) TaxID=698758 RepID=K0J261_AMPXN|nr:phosphoribosylformylglycinamidine cyclo-ligase [Amphibacillus xylanus]BAM46566.1 phosphoribosylformylglycinamidine cyclo-ligase [Amphibacillus xylanus NBRC 15112]